MKRLQIKLPKGKKEGGGGYKSIDAVSNSREQRSGPNSAITVLHGRVIDGVELDPPNSHPFPTRCHPETRKTLRAKLTTWLDNPDRNDGLFCVTGPVCIGKTAVAKTIADYCQQSGRLGAALFLTHNNHNDDASRVIITLAHQLAQRNSSFCQAIVEALKKNPQIFESDLAKQFSHLIAVPSKAFKKWSPFGKQEAPVIILDGLDQCENPYNLLHLLELISDFIHRQHNKSPFKWIVFCRPIPQWRNIFLRKTTRHETLSVDDVEAVTDVANYILRDGFHDIRNRFPGLLNGENWPPDYQRRRLVRAASGFFMYAQCIIQFIGDERIHDPKSQLNICIDFLDNPHWPRENNPFSVLHFIYQRILSDIDPDALSEAIRVLGLSAYSQSETQQSTLTIVQSLNVELPMLYGRLDGLRSVFAAPLDEAPAEHIAFFHSSFVDFLKYRINPSKVPLGGAQDPNHPGSISGDLALVILSPTVMKGSEIDSTIRQPLPRCHRGTRQLFRGRVSTWLADMNREEHMLWVTGPAGAGKSTIAQNLAEYCQNTGRLGAAVFLSPVVDGYDDARRLLPTLAYQLAVQYPDYKTLVNMSLMNDPCILEKDIRSQFTDFITKPLEVLQQGQRFYSTANPLVIVLDGLDQCGSRAEQIELINLLVGFTQRSSASPGLLWIICCRPEPHFKKMLQRMDVQCAYKHEELSLDGIDARDDVEQMLRDGFHNIRRQYIYRFGPTEIWPTDIHWLRLRDMSVGFLMFASCILRFVGDEDQRDPRAMLELALQLVDDSLVPHALHPFHALDSLYEQIVISINLHNLPTAIRILSLCTHHSASGLTVQNIMDVLHIDRAAFDSALDGLHSVLKIPPRGNNDERVRFYHSSFSDFLRDPQRSGQIARQITEDQEIPPRPLNRPPASVTLADPAIEYVPRASGSGSASDIPIRRPNDRGGS